MRSRGRTCFGCTLNVHRWSWWRSFRRYPGRGPGTCKSSICRSHRLFPARQTPPDSLPQQDRLRQAPTRRARRLTNDCLTLTLQSKGRVTTTLAYVMPSGCPPWTFASAAARIGRSSRSTAQSQWMDARMRSWAPGRPALRVGRPAQVTQAPAGSARAAHGAAGDAPSARICLSTVILGVERNSLFVWPFLIKLCSVVRAFIILPRLAATESEEGVEMLDW